MANNDVFETVKGEDSTYTDEALYNITSFGNDINFRQLVEMYDDGDIVKPELQRKYVWSKKEASRFIDSVLLGLPVPSIFLAKIPNNKMLIIDGYQRIMTVRDFMRGVFSGDDRSFALSKTEGISAKWQGLTYAELPEEQKRAIRTYSIHAIVFEQKHPADDTAMYQIFERINTGGQILRPQEIRNCVYQGSFNTLLFDLNKLPVWRKVLGIETEDARMADVELILRFFALAELKHREEYNRSRINLMKYLNDFMYSKKNVSESELSEYKERFVSTITFLHKTVGDSLFKTCKVQNGILHWAKKINPVVFDSVCIAAVNNFNMIRECDDVSSTILTQKYEELLTNDNFIELTKTQTTDIDNIKQRIAFASDILFGE